MFSNAISLIFLFAATFPAFSQVTLTSEQPQKNEYMPQQKIKLKQADELAEKFVQRWRETMDLKILFEEFVVKNPKYRNKNFGEWTGEGEAVFFYEFYFLINNSFFLDRELRLAYGENENYDCLCPLKFMRQLKILEKEFDDLSSIFMSMEGDDQNNSFDNLYDVQKKYIAKRMNEFLSKFIQISKVALPPDVFTSDVYKSRLEKEYPITEETKPKLCNSGFPVDLEESIQCYFVRRGVFDLYIIEEDKQMRVLWIDDGWG